MQCHTPTMFKFTKMYDATLIEPTRIVHINALRYVSKSPVIVLGFQPWDG